MDTNQPNTSEVSPSKVKRRSAAKVSRQRCGTLANELANQITTAVDCQDLRKTTYPSPLFSLFPPVIQNVAVFGDEDPELTYKSWTREYRNARYLMERQKTRYLTLRNGREKAVMCKDCQTKEEKTMRIACQNSWKQVESKHCDTMFLIEGRVVKESEKRLFDSTAIPTNLNFSRKCEMKTSLEGGYIKQNKPITTKKPALSKVSFDKLQPWLTEDKTNPRVKIQQYPCGSWNMYLPHHC